MTVLRSEDGLAGLVALALALLIGFRIRRGLQSGRLPIYRTYLHREDDRRRFGMLLAFQFFILILLVIIAADLLLDLGLREKI